MVCLDRNTSTESRYCSWFRLGVDIITALSIFIINSFILFAVLRYRKQQGPLFPHSSKISILLAVNLSTADVMVGVYHVYLFLPFYLCTMAEYLGHNFLLCILRSVLIIKANFASGFTLVAIAVDRYVAVMHPLRYGDIMSTRRAWIMIGITWVLAILLASPLFYWNYWVDGDHCDLAVFQPKSYDILGASIYILIIVGSLTVIYWKIHHVALRVHSRRNQHDLSATQKINTRSARMILGILIVNTVSCLPYLIALYIENAGYKLPSVVFEVSATLTKVSFLANPFIYGFNIRPVRYSLLKALQTFKRTLSPKINISIFRTGNVWNITSITDLNSEPLSE